jgi:perosamine synthetase
MYRQRPLAVAGRKAECGLNLPSFFDLTRADVARVAREVNALLSEMSCA